MIEQVGDFWLVLVLQLPRPVRVNRKPDWDKLLQLPDGSWIYVFIAAACLVVMIWGVLQFVARVNEDVDPAEVDREMLQSLKELHREGDLTEDEFRSIKGQILERLQATCPPKLNSGTPKPGGGIEQNPGESVPLVQSSPDSSVQPEPTAESSPSGPLMCLTDLPETSQNTEKLPEQGVTRKTENGGGESV